MTAWPAILMVLVGVLLSSCGERAVGPDAADGAAEDIAGDSVNDSASPDCTAASDDFKAAACGDLDERACQASRSCQPLYDEIFQPMPGRRFVECALKTVHCTPGWPAGTDVAEHCGSDWKPPACEAGRAPHWGVDGEGSCATGCIGTSLCLPVSCAGPGYCGKVSGERPLCPAGQVPELVEGAWGTCVDRELCLDLEDET